MKYLITGGAGFIGSHIVESLKTQENEIIIIDNLFSGKLINIQPFLNNKISFIHGDITNLKLLKSICKNIDGIFHEAAVTSVPRSIKDPITTNKTNITGTLNVLIAAKECNVPKVVFASSSSVYGNTPTLPKSEFMELHPLSPYALTKATGEHYMRLFSELYGLKTISLRYFNVFGPRQNPNSEYSAVIPIFITRILQNQPIIIFGDGNQSRDFTFVKDVVQANINAMKSKSIGTINIAYNQTITLNNLAHLIMDIVNKQVPIIYRPQRKGDVLNSIADISKAKQLINYNPNYTVNTGLKETIQWYMKQ